MESITGLITVSADIWNIGRTGSAEAAAEHFPPQRTQPAHMGGDAHCNLLFSRRF